MATLFQKKVYVDKPETTKDKATFGRYVRGFVLGLILVIILGFVAFKVGDFLNTVGRSWKELEFAYRKPTIVQAVRKDYEAQQHKMEQSFLQGDQKSSEDQLIDEVVKKLKDSEDF